MYFEEFEPGQTFTTPGRTVTEADVAAFAAWTGDFNPLHTDDVFARGSQFGERIAHGLLGVSLCIGLMARIGIFEGSAVALLGIDDWRFEAPILIGDTVHCRIDITDVRLTSKGTTGVVGRLFSLLNHKDEAVQRGRMDVLVATRPEAGEPR